MTSASPDTKTDDRRRRVATAWFRAALWRARGTWLAIAATVALGAGASVTVAWSIGPLVGALGQAGTTATAYEALWGVGGILVAAVLIRSVSSLAQAILAERMKQRVAFELRLTLFDALMLADRGDTEDKDEEVMRGDLAARLGGDVAQVEVLTQTVAVGLLASTATALALAGYAATIDAALTGLTLVALTPLLVFLSRMSTRVRGSYRELWEERGRLTGFLTELIAMLPVVRAFGAEPHMQGRFRTQASHLQGLAIRAAWVRSIVGPVVALLSAVAFVAIIIVAGERYDAGGMERHAYVSFLAALALMHRPVQSLGAQGAQIAAGFGALDRLASLLARGAATGLFGRKEGETTKTNHDIHVDGITFDYGSGPVLEGVDLTLRTGTSLAIIGRSGSGKTTLLRLLAGALTPTAGAIRVDGKEADRGALRSHFAWVPQEPQLLSMSAAANIALADENPRSADVSAAADAAGLGGLGGLGERLGERFERQLAEGGEDLSVGERQRVCIARALYRGAHFLLLDEPTASLDGVAEASLAKTIASLVDDHGVIISSHRRSTVERATRVVILEEGRIVEEGTPEHLEKNSTRYAELLGPNKKAP